jgi:glutaredoxin 3
MASNGNAGPGRDDTSGEAKGIQVRGMPEVRIYTTPFCGYCTRAKRLLESKGLPYEEIDVSRDLPKRRWLVEATGMTTVPQVFVDGVSHGGFTDLLALDREGRLDGILGLGGSASGAK